jgi:CO/xanthine dehydrogenase FAD-binding subunit
MERFAYANPTTIQEAVSLLGAQWGEADVLAGGTDLISLMKEHILTPKRVVNIKNIKELGGISKTSQGLRIGALVTMDELAKNADVQKSYASIS